MYPVPGTCPICGEQMFVTGLRCPECSTEISGVFELSRLSRLKEDQLHFLEMLLKNRANVLRTAEELEISYSAARGRLDDIVRALGFPLEEPPAEPVPPEQRKQVLQLLAEGKISAQEALEMLEKGRG